MVSEPQTQRDTAFPRLDGSQIAALERIATRHRLQDGEALFRAGASRGGFFVVLSGALEIIDDSGVRKARGGRRSLAPGCSHVNEDRIPVWPTSHPLCRLDHLPFGVTRRNPCERGG